MGAIAIQARDVTGEGVEMVGIGRAPCAVARLSGAAMWSDLDLGLFRQPA